MKVTVQSLASSFPAILKRSLPTGLAAGAECLVCGGFSCICFLQKQFLSLVKKHKRLPLETSSAFEARNSERAWHKGDRDHTRRPEHVTH